LVGLKAHPPSIARGSAGASASAGRSIPRRPRGRRIRPPGGAFAESRAMRGEVRTRPGREAGALGTCAGNAVASRLMDGPGGLWPQISRRAGEFSGRTGFRDEAVRFATEACGRREASVQVRCAFGRAPPGRSRVFRDAGSAAR